MRPLFLVCLFLLPFFLPAQENAADSTLRREKKLGILPVPSFGYTPETNWYVGAVSLFTLRHFQDSLTRTSTAKAEFNYTLNHQWIAEAGFNLFTPAEKFNAEGLLGFRKFPEYIWAAGPASPDSSRELYDGSRIETDLRFSRQVKRSVFIGLRYRLQYLFNLSTEDGGLLDSGQLPGSAGGLSSGAGIAFAWDSRRNVLNPREGHYTALSVLGFSKLTGSSYDFFRIEVDARKYFPARRNKDVFAVQAYALLTPGEAPFRLMPLLGSDREMRGYYQGRYRDRYYSAFQAEYRMHLFWRLGAVAFAGIGDVWSGKPSSFQGLRKYSIGTGLRFLMDKKDNVNLRLDFAWGRGTSGFYVAFGESF